jgi:biopolymer transport protein ExbD
MQFDRGSTGTELNSEINVTPLVDVVLVLLIIFMVVVPLLLKGYNVDMPPTSVAAAPAQAEQAQVILRIGPTTCNIVQPPAGEGLPADCRVNLAGEDIAAAELPARVATILGGRPANGRVLFLAADDKLNYEGVLRVVDLAKSNVDDLTIEFVAND